MSDREITDLLARAGDDHGLPLRTDPDRLLARARRDGVRRRVRGVGAVLAAAAVVAGVVLAPRLVGDRAAEPVAPRPTTQPSPVLSAATIVARCRPQLAKYAGVPGYDADPVTGLWHLNHEGRRYRAGDLVQLGEQGGDVGRPVLCLIPHRGHEQDPVGFDRLTPRAGDVNLLRAVCAEQATEVGDGGVRIPDLRRATVVASSFDGQVGAALLRGPDGHYYGCATGSPTSDLAPVLVDRTTGPHAFRSGSGMFIAAGGIGAAGSAFAVLAGRLGPRARTLELTIPQTERPDLTFPIRNSYVAAAARWKVVARDDRLQVRVWQVNAADGTVLASGTF